MWATPRAMRAIHQPTTTGPTTRDTEDTEAAATNQYPLTTTGPTTRDTVDTEAAATDQYHPPKTIVPTTRDTEDTEAAATDQYLYTHPPVVDTPPPTCGIIFNIACVSLYPALIFTSNFCVLLWPLNCL